MRMSNGARLGPYEILAPLGAGGMGEVYRARDSRLKRDVAIKILPPEFSTDDERLARFTREAQALAALNHPNIATIYGIEETSDARALIMELVEGRTLADRLEQGPIDVDDAIPIARQIADALEAAHEKGIIHRDLKPANIALTADGEVKVLDFGLAKALEPEGTADPSLSPTLTLRATQAGVILGTAAYMSPEQARGRASDKRTDVWAFGCVLYEMLTAKRAFEGEDVTDTIAAVVRAEPDWSELAKRNVPAQIELLIRRCLIKDRKQRISDIGVARFLISEMTAVPAAAAAMRAGAAKAPRKRLAFAAAAGVLAGAALAALGMSIAARFARVTPPQTMRLEMLLSQPLTIQGVDRDFAISPAGTHVVYRSGSGQSHFVVRPIDQSSVEVLAATSGGRQPFFSPDGRWVGFFAGSELKKVSITGGPAVTLCRIVGPPRGATWGEDDTITFATGDATVGLQRVSAAGGTPVTLTTPDTAQGGGDHLYPSVVPGGRGVLYTIASGTARDNMQIAVFDQRSNQSKTIVRGGSDAAYVSSGQLVYAAAGALRAARFDAERLEPIGDAVPVVEQVATTTLGTANYSVSRTGTLVYLAGFGSGSLSAQRQLVWVNRQGQEEPIKGAPLRAYTTPRISPDGTRLAVSIADQEQDIWVWDFKRSNLTRLTFNPGADTYPVWTRNSQRIIFGSARDGVFNAYSRAADGTGADQPITTMKVSHSPQSITPDGTRLLLFENDPKLGPGIVSLAMNNASTTSSRTDPLIQTVNLEWQPEVSPNGRWLAYASNKDGQFDVYVCPFPAIDSGLWQVSTGGGTKPVWAPNGRELFYLDTTDNLVAVPVETTEPTFSYRTAVKLIEGRYFGGAPPNRAYDVAPDGQRFLMLKDALGGNPSTPSSLVVVVNWHEELKKRVGATR